MKFFTSSSKQNPPSDRIDDLVGIFAPKKESIGQKFSNLFNSKTNEPPSTNSNKNTPDEEQGGLLGSIKSNIGSGISKSSNYITGLKTKMQDVQTAAENWKNFAILFFFGLFFLFSSFAFLPVFVLIPSKFASLFTLGSICIIVSVAVIKGFSEFFKLMIKKEKIFYSITYLITIIGTLYAAVIKKAYILTLIFSIAQVFSLAFFVSSSFPGGTNGMIYISKKLFGMVKGFCGMCFKQVQLP